MLERYGTYFLIGATFLLLLIGGMVNPTGSSLACPEPTLICHGQLFPRMTGGVLFEHGHRLAAMTVGLVQIALTVLLWRRRPRLRKLGVLALVLVCVQGALGAITVKYKLPWAVSTAHLLMAMTYLATLLLIGRKLTPAAPVSDQRAALATRLRPVIGVAAVAVLFQILLGGLVRHNGAALASIDLPLHHGQLWPDGPPLLKLHMAHRIAGVLVGTLVIGCALYVAAAAKSWRRLRVMALALPVVVVGQISLGVLVIATFRAVPVAVAHFGGAALLWSLLCAMWWMASEAAHEARAKEAAAVGQLEKAVAV